MRPLGRRIHPLPRGEVTPSSAYFLVSVVMGGTTAAEFLHLIGIAPACHSVEALP